MIIYLAGPITTDPKTHIWRENFPLAVAPHICLSPLRGEDVTTFSADGLESAEPPSIQVARDERDLERADVVVLNTLGVENLTRQSIGTFAEFGLARAYQKPIVVIADHDSVLRHPFIRRWAAAIVSTVPDAVAAVKWFEDPPVNWKMTKIHNN